jgi:hypothetical protein
MMSVYCFGLDVIARLFATVSRGSFDCPLVTAPMLGGAHRCQEAIDLDL